MSIRLALMCTSVVSLSACATKQENPNYQHSTRYEVSQPYQQASHTDRIQAAPVRYDGDSPRYDTIAPDHVVYKSPRIDSTRYSVRAASDTGAREYVSAPSSDITYSTPGTRTSGDSTTHLARHSSQYQQANQYQQVEQHPIPPAPTSGTSNFVRTGTAPQPQSGESTTSYVYSSSPYNPSQEVVVAPTDRAYTGLATGTPGYEAVMGSLNGTQTAQPIQPVTAQPQYGAPQPSTIYAPVNTTQEYIYNSAPQPAYQTYTQPVPQNFQAQQVRTQAQMQNIGSGPAIREVVEGDTLYSLARARCVSVEELQTMNSIGSDFKIRLGESINLPASRC